ncbi:DDB1- and CUL4-associated factor 8-like [Asterias rubens]|uniref:DDB1- and CUL4-associated factor 8-like n=1 Tax=Asterias rubens TaxID=7604 RepID=UPI001455C02C|nr:DDB1- and CUL4-associated factor 8-like [Asterias rubens]
MADEDTDMTTEGDRAVLNSMDTDDKGDNHCDANNYYANDKAHQHEKGDDKDIGLADMEENCTGNSYHTVKLSEGDSSSGGLATGMVRSAGTSRTEGGGAKGGMTTEDASGVEDQDEGGSAKDGTASEEGGDSDEGMATDNATTKKLSKRFKVSGHVNEAMIGAVRKSNCSKRSYRLRDLETGDLDSDDDSESDDDSRDSNSSTRQSHSSTSETESDMEREGNEGAGEAQSKAAELSSDLEDDLLAKILPKPTWQAIPMLRARELGMRRELSSFRNEAVGSVHMTSRFEKYCELKHHDGCVNTLHFNQSGKLLASGSDDLHIALWDWAQKKTTLVYNSGHRSNVFQAKFMPFSGDTTLVSCARDGQVRVGELSSTGICKGTKKLVQHKGAAHKLGVGADSPVVFMSCGEDAVVYSIDLRTSKATKLVTVKENERKVALYTIFLNPSDTNEFCVGGRDHFVRVYDRRKVSDDREGLLKKFCPQHMLNSETRANVTCCVYSYNGREIVASYNDEDIYLFDSSHSDGADFIHSYKGHRNNATVKGVNFYGPRSEFIVSGSDCGNVFLWEKSSEKIIQYMKGDTGGVVNCLESHPTSAVLATSGLDHDVKIWMPTAQEPSQLEGLKTTMYSNRREREEERGREPDVIDGHMLMFLMHHLRRRARRQARESGDVDSDSSSSDSDTSDYEEGDNRTPNERVQCAPS